MSRRHDPYHPRVQPAKVQPAEDSPDRPFWSVMIPVHADCSYLAAAIKSVLAEAIEPAAMQIEVVDAAPGDHDAMHITGEAGGGRVDYHAATEVLSPRQAWNRCISRARGRWVHILHDDDLVQSGFYRAMQAAIAKYPRIAAAFCRVQYLDDKGRKLDLATPELAASGIYEKLPARLVQGNAVSFPTMVVKREAYEEVGGFDPNLDITADWEMWMRLACRFPVYYDTRPLAAFRRYVRAKETSPLVRSGADIRELHGTLNVFADYLPQTPASAALLHHSREHKALVAIRSSKQLAAAGDLYAATAQVREAFACSSSPKVIREIEEAGTFRQFAAFLKQLNDHAQHHRVTLHATAAVAPLKQARLLIAKQWLDFGSDATDDLLASDLGAATATLIGGSVRDEPLDDADQAFFEPLRAELTEASSPRYGQRLMTALLMARPWELPAVELTRLTGPVLGTYLRDALLLPVGLSSDAQLAAYGDFLADLLSRVRGLVESDADAQTRQDVATLVANNLNLLVLRSTGSDITQVIADRAKIVDHALAGVGVRASHNFGAPRPVGSRMRVGIITNVLNPTRDTFEALPCFELDRTKLHITAYTAAPGDSAIEKIVRDRVDRFVTLSETQSEQVRMIRSENYDAVLIAADLTVSASPAAVLASARLCRRQIATGSYGLKPGLIPSIDDVWPDVCFHIPPGVGAASVWPAREQLGLRPEPIVFASAANSLRITPQTRRMWAALLRDVPGSRLVLLPYSPQWGLAEYQGVPFVRAMNAALAAEQVDVNRMIVVNPLPQRQDVLAVLKLADVYLDAFPETGGLSIYDALEAGLPVVSGSSILKQVGAPVIDSEQAYHDLATLYANSPEERDMLREAVRKSTRVTPPFLDREAYGRRLTDFLAPAAGVPTP
jgi:hypothetical protein